MPRIRRGNEGNPRTCVQDTGNTTSEVVCMSPNSSPHPPSLPSPRPLQTTVFSTIARLDYRFFGLSASTFGSPTSRTFCLGLPTVRLFIVPRPSAPSLAACCRTYQHAVPHCRALVALHKTSILTTSTPGYSVESSTSNDSPRRDEHKA